jgi:hypothetical protein
LIPDRFTKIKFRYYDPLNDLWGIDILNEYITYLDTILIKKDNENPRLNSKYYKDYLPIEVISKTKKKSYIILDLAHAFIPSKKGFVKLHEGANINNDEKKDEFEVVWLYPQSYLGDIKPNEYFEYFNVLSDNTVITYYDKLFDKKINIDDFEDWPSYNGINEKDKLYQIMYRINPRIHQKNSNSYYKLSEYQMQYNNQNIQDIIINIYLKHMKISIFDLKKQMWDKLWTDIPYSFEELLQLLKIPAQLQKEIDDEIEVELNKIKKPEFKKP